VEKGEHIMIKKADVEVIGGGISGVAIAYNLAKKGVKNVVLLEKGYLASGATGRCGAGIRQQWGTEMNCRIAKLACELFENGNEELQYDGDIEFKQGGYLIVSSTEKEHEQFKKNVALQNSLGIPSKLLNLDEAKEIVPFLNTDGLVSATFCQKDGHLNPFYTTDAYAKAAERLGVKIYRFTEVTDVVVENGKIRGVKTNKGDIETYYLWSIGNVMKTANKEKDLFQIIRSGYIWLLTKILDIPLGTEKIQQLHSNFEGLKDLIPSDDYGKILCYKIDNSYHYIPRKYTFYDNKLLNVVIKYIIYT